MTIFCFAHYQACYFIFIYSDLILGVPCISRSLKIIWTARISMSFLDVWFLSEVRTLRLKCVMHIFLVTHSQSKPGKWAALTVNSVNHSGIWLLSQNIPGSAGRSLQVIAPTCLPKDDLENWLEDLLFPSYQKLTYQKFADTATLC